jgi:RNA polymerase sigma factor (sigma-70 family)
MSKIPTQTEWNEVYNRVYGYFYRRLSNRSSVEDLTARVCEDFFLKEKNLQDQNAQNAYLWAIAKNKLNSFLKEKYRHNHIDELEENDHFSTDFKTYSGEFREIITQILECVQTNSGVLDRQILEMTILEDFKASEVATKLGLSYSNLRTKLHRAIKKTRQKCGHLWHY